MLNLKTKYDVVIVGAGVAGCTVAKYLSRDFSVLIIERSKIPREKSCGGLLIKDSMDFINKESPPEYIFSIPRKLKVRFVDWDNDIEIKSEEEVWNISRKELDYWLFKLIKERVDVLLETLLVDIKKGKEIELTIRKNHQSYIVKTKYLVGADGAWSTVRNKIFHKKIKYCLTAQQWIRLSLKLQTFDFIFYNKITDFYSWLIPKGEYLILGVGLRPKQNINKEFAVLKDLINQKMGINGETIKTEDSIGLTPQSIDDIILGEKNIILVGEAAGLIGPSDGEGISYALGSGHFCAQMLAEDSDKTIKIYRDLCQPLLDRYASELQTAKILFDPQKRPTILKML